MIAAGPFVTAQWALFFLPQDYGEIVPWFMQNRGDSDILIHPNTGYEIEDHRDWTLSERQHCPIFFFFFFFFILIIFFLPPLLFFFFFFFTCVAVVYNQ